jgi:integrase
MLKIILKSTYIGGILTLAIVVVDAVYRNPIGSKRLSGEGVGIVVKRYVEGLGFDPSQFGGHSLRAGLATSAAAAGKSERAILHQTGHRSVNTVRRYIRDGNLFRENAAEGLGL